MKASARSREPKKLLEGKRFHKNLQGDWKRTAEGYVEPEKRIVKPSGRQGRIDIFVESDGLPDSATVVEIKVSDWDKMAVHAVGMNVKRQSRQIWGYIESQLLHGKDVFPGVVFPKRPRKVGRLDLIEKLFEIEGISVVWQDESIIQRKGRL